MANLKGNLESIPLADVLQLLNVNRKTGMLQVVSGKESGVLYFVEGEVVQAETQVARGEVAAFDILEWTKGNFEFLAMAVKSQTAIKRKIQDLMMEAARTSDSRKRLRQVFPDRNAIPWPSTMEPELTSGIKVYAEDKKVIPYFDGYRDFAEVIQLLDTHEVPVLQAASILLEAGRLSLLQPTIQVTVAQLKGFFKKSDHVELSKSLETMWRSMGPYADGVENVRIMWPKGPAVEAVQFTSMDEHTIAVPKELLQSWEIKEGDTVSVRPAP